MKRINLNRCLCTGKLYTLLCVLGLLLSIQLLNAQNSLQLKGQVVDPAGESIIGASVQERGTTNGTVTDLEGNFSLNILQM